MIGNRSERLAVTGNAAMGYGLSTTAEPLVAASGHQPHITVSTAREPETHRARAG